MSESQFLSERIDKFTKAHPSTDGWKVYVCWESLYRKLFLNYLLDFIRDRHPEILRRRFGINEVRTDDMIGGRPDSHSTESGSDWDLKRELDGNNWWGEVDVEWKSYPVHYSCFSYSNEMSRDSLALVATKSNAVLRELHRLLISYGQERVAGDGRRVIVVNGEDIVVPKVSWGDVFLPDGQAAEIQKNAEAFFGAREQYQAMGIPHRRGFLFTGPAGCGKTLTLKALANHSKATFIAVQARAGVGDDDIEGGFNLAATHAPSVLIFEDLDRLVDSKRISISHFLNTLDGLKASEGVLVIATSNHPENLDPALIHRPSRFDRVWRFSLPNKSQRLALLTKRGSPYFSKKALEMISAKSAGFSMAYVQEIVVNALLDIAHNNEKEKDECLTNSLETLKAQRKLVAASEEDLAERENLGFATSRGKESVESEMEKDLELMEHL